MSKCSWEKELMPLVDRFAGHRWKNDPELEDKRCDARSVAWELWQAAQPEATPQSIAMYAIRRVCVGRQFSESVSSLTGPNPKRIDKPQRATLDVSHLFKTGDDPARIVLFRDLL